MLFSQITEQSELINTLIGIAHRQRVSHAQLFFGQEEAKGFALALAYAQYLNCTNKITYNKEESLIIGDSCGECACCKKYSKLSHPDLHFIFPNTTTKKIDSKNSSELLMNEFRDFVLKNNGNIKLNDWYAYLDVGNKQGTINVRDANNIIKALSVKSYEAEFKVMIIWCVDKLYYEAAPKLLKILEEPYDNTLFFLITSDRENILPTILSRTQLVKIPQIKKNKDTNNKYMTLFEEWLRNCFAYKTNINNILQIIETDILKLGRESQKEFLEFSLEIFQNILLKKYDIDIVEDFFKNTNEKFKTNFPSFITNNNIDKIYNEIDKAILYIERNGNAKMVFLDLSINLGILLTNK